MHREVAYESRFVRVAQHDKRLGSLQMPYTTLQLAYDGSVATITLKPSGEAERDQL